MKQIFECVPIAEVASHPDADQNRPVVLVVDDEKMIADTLALILSNHGFAPMVAYGATSALEMARIIPPDLLLSDIAMPGMTGVELAIAISNRISDCKVLLFSGQASTLDLLSDARAAGYNFPSLTKPIHPTALLARISRCLEDCEPVVNLAQGFNGDGYEAAVFASRGQIRRSNTL